MFTGIVEERGQVVALEAGRRLEVLCGRVSEGTTQGDSVAVSGVCLTVVARTGGGLAFELSDETRLRTTLDQLSEGDPVNLERPLTLASRLGGHLVQGHVDAVGRIEEMERNGGGARMRVAVPEELHSYLVPKGSIAVDGVSLTVAALDGRGFEAALVPHTLEVTTLGVRQPGDPVNLEVDVLAKYVERMTRRET